MIPSVRGSHGREKGAAATLVAVLAAGGVLLGMLALSVDVGNMMFERRQLQNGADATAMALAQLCAEDLTQCDPALTMGTLAPLNNANAVSDGTHGFADRPDTVNGQCGRVPGANMPWCDSVTSPADIANLAECPALPAWLAGAPGIPYVETYTQSQSSAGPVLDFFFQGGGATIVNCARAAWGPGKAASVLPLTFSDCEWNVATADGTDYGKEVGVPLNYEDKTYCDSVVGRDYNGGFGWLDHSTGACDVPVDEGWVPGTPGMGKGTDCMHLVQPGATIYIPIFDCINDDKNYCPVGEKVSPSTFYHIAGYGSFEVTGYRLPGGPLIGSPGGAAVTECEAKAQNKHCLYGRFNKALMPVGEISTDPDFDDFGYTIVQPAG